MEIKSFQGGYDKNISYLVWCKTTLSAGIIDASVNFDRINELIKLKKLKLEKIFITHTHIDHIYYLKQIVRKYPKIEIFLFKNPEIPIKQDFNKLHHHDTINIGMEMITILYTPGHYPDSICFWNKEDQVLFTGDTMFVGRTGRTISKKSNISDLYNSIYNIILKLPEETIIYPGHHYGHIPNITLKKNLLLHQFFNCNSLDEFIKVMNLYEQSRNKNK